MRNLCTYIKRYLNSLKDYFFMNRNVLFVCGVLILAVLIYLVPKSFALLQPVKSIEIYSEKLNYQNKEPGAWKITKSAKWIKQGEIEITFDIDSILKKNENLADILFVLDISSSMYGEKLDRVKSDSIQLIEELLSNGKNRAGLITFDSDSEILSNFTNDKAALKEKINNLTDRGYTNYYQALVNVDTILKNYQKAENRDCIVLFLTDGFPNEGIPNEIGQYNYLKNNYPYVKINAIQYEMGSEILDQIKNISDKQFIADMKTLNNVLFDASGMSFVYDTFKITDYLDTNYFYVENEKNVSVNQGEINFDKNNQKVELMLNDYKSGTHVTMTIKAKLKEDLGDTEKIYPTNEHEEIISKIESIEENIISKKTPVLADNFKVIYDGNAPAGCSISDVPAKINYSVFETVEVSSVIPKCQEYQFKGWDISTKGVVKINDGYFVMPEEDVVLKAKWSKMSVRKTMNGEIYVSQPPVLQERSGNEKIWKYNNSITKVIIETQIDIPASAVESWDVSDNGSGVVMAYIVPNESDSSTYTAHIQGTDVVIANKDSSYLFYSFQKLEEIIGMENLDTSQVTNMSGMFYDCRALTSLDLSNFSTSQVTNMSNMFMDCYSLISLVISSFDTSQVTNMSGMFYACQSITRLDLSNFDTSQVTDMNYMFNNCYLLTSIDVTNFDTSQVTNMNYMFNDCRALTSLNVSNFDTSKVTSMERMFGGCSSLVTLDVNKFDTSQVTNMNYMFSDCRTLTSLDVSNFNTSKVIDMGGMFSSCRSFTSLDVSNFDTSQVIDMHSMFSDCSRLASLNLSNFDTSQVTDMSWMFCRCHFSSLDLNNFNTLQVTNMNHMFFQADELSTTISITNPMVSSYSSMFEGAAYFSYTKIIVNYTSSTSDLVDLMIATKSSSSNVVKGEKIPEYSITVTGNDDIVSDINGSLPGRTINLNSKSGNNVVVSFKLNGVTISGSSFVMPEANVTITDIVTIEMTVIESEHNPYPNSLNNKVYGEKTFSGATSLTVVLDYQTESTNYDWVYLYDGTGKQYGKYGGKTMKTETITIPGDYVKIVFRTDSSGNSYYGFKASIIPSYD